MTEDDRGNRSWTRSEAMYTDGSFLEASTGGDDADYKVSELERILRENQGLLPDGALRVADIGCGTGQTTNCLAKTLARLGWAPRVTGFDVHPSVDSLEAEENVRFVRADYLEEGEPCDLAVLFDVIEHIPGPLEFLRGVARKARFVALHIPLDNSVLSLARGMNRTNLTLPGHLVILDIPAALNIVTLSGLRPIDYLISPAFRAPSGRLTRGQKLLSPIRSALYRWNPYLLQRTLGGVSLTVLARSPLTHD